MRLLRFGVTVLFLFVVAVTAPLGLLAVVLTMLLDLFAMMILTMLLLLVAAVSTLALDATRSLIGGGGGLAVVTSALTKGLVVLLDGGVAVTVAAEVGELRPLAEGVASENN